MCGSIYQDVEYRDHLCSLQCHIGSRNLDTAKEKKKRELPEEVGVYKIVVVVAYTGEVERIQKEDSRRRYQVRCWDDFVVSTLVLSRTVAGSEDQAE